MVPAPQQIERDHGITARTIAFAAHLRLNGFRVGPRETEAALDVIRHSALDRLQLQQGLKSLLTGRREEWERFDGLFEAFWFGRGREQAGSPSARALRGWWRSCGA